MFSIDKRPSVACSNSDVLSFVWHFLHVELGRGVLMRSRKPLNRHSGLVRGYLSQSSKLCGVLEASEHSFYAFSVNFMRFVLR